MEPAQKRRLPGFTIIYNIDLRSKRPILDEIIETTLRAAQENDVRVTIELEEESNQSLYERTGAYGTAKYNLQEGRGDIVISRKAKNDLSDLGLKGLLYHLIGMVYGFAACGVSAADNNAEYGEVQGMNKTRSHKVETEAFFDCLMLNEGGTAEALVAYRVETAIEDFKEAQMNEQRIARQERFQKYCGALKKLQPKVAEIIEQLVLLRTRQYLPQNPEQTRYEN